MAGTYQTPTTDQDAIRDAFRQVKTMLDEVARMDAGQLRNDVARLQGLIDGLINQVNGIFTGYVQAAGNITSTAGRGYFAGQLWSPGSAATDLSVLAGLRQTTWQIYSGANNGLLGYSPSSFRSKTHWRKAEFTAAQFLACFPYVYEYRGQVAIRDDKRHPSYDPNYIVPLEIGYLAELLIKHGLGIFVVMKDGHPIGIDYASFAAVGMTVIGRELAMHARGQQARIEALEARIEAAGL